MDLDAVFSIVEICCGPAVAGFMRRKQVATASKISVCSEDSGDSSVCVGDREGFRDSPERTDIDNPYDKHCVLASECFLPFTYLLQNENLAMGLSIELHPTLSQRTGCAAEILAHTAERRLSITKPSKELTEERAIFHLLLSVPCSDDPCLSFQKQKALAMALAAFPGIMSSFFESSTSSIEEKTSVACCLQDALYNFTKTNSVLECQYVERSTERNLMESMVQEVLSKIGSNTAGVPSLIYFFTRALEYGHHQLFMESLQKHGRRNFERLIVGELLLVDDQLNDGNYQDYNDALCLLDKFISYAADMGSLTSNTHQELYADITLWALEHATNLVRCSKGEYMFSFAERSKRGLHEEGSCHCSTLRTLTSIFLKALCVQARLLNREDAEMTTTFLSRMRTILDSLLSDCDLHRLSGFENSIFAVFGGDDEDMCGALLCCLHLNLLFEDVVRQNSANNALLNPTNIFNLLIEKISRDHWILVSWISDDQNCFLIYFTQYLKYIDNRRLLLSQNQMMLLRKVEKYLKISQKCGKLAFNSAPLLRRLQNVFEVNQTSK